MTSSSSSEDEAENASSQNTSTTCPCEIKRKKASSIKCVACCDWWHQSCAGLAGLTSTMLGKIKEWKCYKCFEPPNKASFKMKMMSTAVLDDMKTHMQESMNNMITEALDTKITETITAKINTALESVNIPAPVSYAAALSNGLPPPSQNTEENPQTVLRTIVRSALSEKKLQDEELEEIQKLKLNLIVSGIPESTATTEEESVRNDATHVKELFREELGIDVQLSGNSRLGSKRTPTAENPNPRPRMMKLVIANQKNRKELLRNAVKLRESEDQHVKDNIFIRPDLTKRQREESKNLRTLLRQKRLENQDLTKQFKIQKGQIITLTVPAGVQTSQTQQAPTPLQNNA